MTPPAGGTSRPIRVAHVTTVDLTLRFLLLNQLRRLRDEGYEVTAISRPGPWVDDLRAEGITHLPWHDATRAWDLRADGRAFRALLSLLREHGFDLVHTHNPKPGILGRIAARMAHVPVVVNTVHGLYATPESSLARRTAVLGLEWAAARLSDLELYQSREDLAWALRLGVARPGRSALLGNGADLTRFDPGTVPNGRLEALRSDLGIGDGASVVGTVGRLVAEKGYGELLAAAREVRARLPGATFLAVGGPDPARPDSFSESELAAGGVVVTGWREDVPDLLALMDVFVLPSWREGVPRSAIEAAAMGKPLILTDVRGCREVARDGREGLLVPPRNPGRLAEAIERLLRDPALRTRLGSAARARAVECFDERGVADRVVGHYRRLLASRGIAAQEAAGPRIRPATQGDAPVIARLHRQGLPDAFLPSLGDGFLSTLYRGLAADRDAVALVAEEDGGVVGFAAGVPSVNRFYRRFAVRRGAVAAAAALPALLRPGALGRIRETGGYPSRTASLPDAELLAIAVAPERQKQGIGAVLAERVVAGVAALGAGEIKVLVAADNVGANRFYERLGFRHRTTISLHAGQTSNVWVRSWASS